MITIIVMATFFLLRRRLTDSRTTAAATAAADLLREEEESIGGRRADGGGVGLRQRQNARTKMPRKKGQGKKNKKNAKKATGDGGGGGSSGGGEPTPSSFETSKKKKKSAAVDLSGDVCGNCMSDRDPLIIQCPRCANIRYCSEDCAEFHWENGHGDLCVPVATLEEEHAASSSAPSRRADGQAEAAAEVVEDDEDDEDDDREYDEHVVALLRASGVEGARAVARAFFEELVDISVLRDCSRQDLREMHVTDNAVAGRILNGAKNPKYSPEDEEYAQVERTPPDDLVCPITGCLFEDPVFASDGETYERQAIRKWIADKRKDVEAARRELRDTRNESERAKRVIEAGVKSPLGIGQLGAALTNNRDMKRRAAQWREANV